MIDSVPGNYVLLIDGGKGHGGSCEPEYMNITSLLHQVDPLIQAIAGLYRDTISCYDYDGLVQEGRLVVLEALRRYLKKHVEISPASISSWVFIAVNSRLKQLATKTSTEITHKRYDRYVPNLTREDGSAYERTMDRETHFGHIQGTQSAK